VLPVGNNKQQQAMSLAAKGGARAGLLFASSTPGFQEGCWVIMWGEHIIMALLREGEGAL